MKKTRPRSVPRAGWVLAASAVALMLGGCRQEPSSVAPQPPPVTVATPELRDVTVFEEFTGTTQARYPISHGAAALGRVGPWLVVGYNEGNLELVRVGKRARIRRPSFTFEGVPSSPPVRILPGPRFRDEIGFTGLTLRLQRETSRVRMDGDVRAGHQLLDSSLHHLHQRMGCVERVTAVHGDMEVDEETGPGRPDADPMAVQDSVNRLDLPPYRLCHPTGRGVQQGFQSAPP